MKKFFALAAAVLFTAISVSAQDMAEATETAKAANEALMTGDNQTALAQFKSALEMAEMCGGEGMELAETCKGIIPKILLSLGKSDVKAKNYDAALTQLKEALETAKAYGSAEVQEDATELIGQVHNQKAAELLNNGDFAGAVEAYKEILANDPTNGMAALRLGMAYGKIGNSEEAAAAYETAMANGQDKNARKQLSILFLKQAQAALKGGKLQDAIDAAEKSGSYLESANAYKIAASAATKLDKKDAAVEYYEKYLELAPNAADANGIICTLAVLYQQAGNKEKAIENYEKILTDAKYGETAKAQLAVLRK